MDHTLWDFKRNSHETLHDLFSKYNIASLCKVNFEIFLNTYESINEQLWQLYGVKQISKEELRYQRFYKTFLKFEYDNLSLAYLWSDDYLKISPYKTHLIDGALDILSYLKNKYELHIITNGFKEVQSIKLETSLLKPFFNHIIISENYQVYKPDIKIFEIALNLSKSINAECIMIGDSFDADIKGALNAGWKAIYLSNDKMEHINDVNFIQINNLYELKTLF